MKLCGVWWWWWWLKKKQKKPFALHWSGWTAIYNGQSEARFYVKRFWTNHKASMNRQPIQHRVGSGIGRCFSVRYSWSLEHEAFSAWGKCKHLTYYIIRWRNNISTIIILIYSSFENSALMRLCTKTVITLTLHLLFKKKNFYK